MMQAALSEMGYFKVMQKWEMDQITPYLHDAGVYISGGSHDIGMREEQFATDLVQWLAKDGWPGIRQVFQVVRGSERAYVAALTSIRYQYFKLLHENLTHGGNSTHEERQAIGNMINVSTGRGDVGTAANFAQWINALFFAPRYVLSRFQYFYGQPLWKLRKAEGLTAAQKKTLAKQFAKEYGRFAVSATALMGMLYLAFGDDDDFEISMDVDSADFMKPRFGDTRVDFFSGLAQQTRILGRTAKTILERADIIEKGDKSLFRPGFGMSDFYDTWTRFMRTKFSPIFTTPINLLSGTDVAGQEYGGERFISAKTAKDVAEDVLLPLSMEDVYKAMEKEGYDKGTIYSVLSILGVGEEVPPPHPLAGKRFHHRLDDRHGVHRVAAAGDLQGDRYIRRHLPGCGYPKSNALPDGNGTYPVVLG
jgi:hypothetical protein